MSDPTFIPDEAQLRRAFIKGITSGLVFPAAACCLWTAFWTLYQVPPHVEVFKSVRVNMPVATEFLMWAYPYVAIFFVAVAIACILATALKGDRWPAAVLNIAACLLGMSWLAFLTVALTGPLMSLLRGIGTR